MSFGVFTFFPFNFVIIKNFLITIFDFAGIGNKNIKSLFLCQNSCSGSTFSGTKYYNTSDPYLSDF